MTRSPAAPLAKKTSPATAAAAPSKKDVSDSPLCTSATWCQVASLMGSAFTVAAATAIEAPLLDVPASALQPYVAKTAPETASAARKQGLLAPLKSAGAAPPEAPDAKRNTRPLAVSATRRRPCPSNARACGPLSESSATSAVAPEAGSLSTCPVPAVPALAIKMAPLASTAMPAGRVKFASCPSCT